MYPTSPGLGMVMRKLEALKAEPDSATETAFAAEIAVAGNAVYVHETDPCSILRWFLHSEVLH